MLGLRFCARAFSSCGERGPLLSRCAGLSLSQPLLLWSTGSRRAGSVVVAHGPGCSAACGIFPDQGSNLCPLHWQADSQPLRHQGSPTFFFYYNQFIIFSCVFGVHVFFFISYLWHLSIFQIFGYFLIFTSNIFKVLLFTFWSLIHQELIFVSDMK